MIWKYVIPFFSFVLLVGGPILKEAQKVFRKGFTVLFVIVLHLALRTFINLVGSVSDCELLILHTTVG